MGRLPSSGPRGFENVTCAESERDSDLDRIIINNIVLSIARCASSYLSVILRGIEAEDSVGGHIVGCRSS